jgi:site-specific DNA recombinase
VVLVIDEVEANVVRQVFEDYIRALGIEAIAGRLNERGVRPPASLRRRGVVAWSKGTVWTMLRNPIYRGRLVYGKARYREVGTKRGKVRRPESEQLVADGAAPPIVSAELWAAAQAKHGDRKFGTGRPWHHPCLLSGLIQCGHCGKRFQAQRQARGRIPAYYLCGGYVASGPGVCPSPRIPISYLDDAVIDGIQKRLDRFLDPTELRRRLEIALTTDRAAHASVPVLEGRLRETERKIARLVDALAAGPEDLPPVRAALVGLDVERQRLEGELDAAKRRTAGGGAEALESVLDELLASLGNVREVLGAGEAEERRTVVRSFLRGVRIEKARQRVVLEWFRIPQNSYVMLVAVGGIEPPTRGL